MLLKWIGLIKTNFCLSVNTFLLYILSLKLLQYNSLFHPQKSKSDFSDFGFWTCFSTYLYCHCWEVMPGTLIHITDRLQNKQSRREETEIFTVLPVTPLWDLLLSNFCVVSLLQLTYTFSVRLSGWNWQCSLICIAYPCAWWLNTWK